MLWFYINSKGVRDNNNVFILRSGFPLSTDVDSMGLFSCKEY